MLEKLLFHPPNPGATRRAFHQAAFSKPVKRRSFPDSFERFTFYVSPFTNDKDDLFEHPAGVFFCCATCGTIKS